ncbi:MAG TPA: discoidin domain-containing protein, partial [Desulfobacterales bacterium]|nr:discoidin domain-containing protein [Desulfobacterales bacterium]
VGTAAAMAVEKKIAPRAVGGHVKLLQQRLLKDDCWIPGCRNEDPADLARTTSVSASSESEGWPAANVVNGVPRNVKSARNAWVSKPMSGPEWIRLDLERRATVKEVILVFDPNLSKEIKISISKRTLSRQVPGIPGTLVRDYDLELLDGSTVVDRVEVRGNYLRRRVHGFPAGPTANRIRLTVHATRGDREARVFEIRAYAGA